MAKKSAPSRRTTTAAFTPIKAEQLNARPDPIDFRDRMFEPSLVEVPLRRTVDEYRAHFPRRRPLILNQGVEGACTGFGLAAVANYLLCRRRVDPDATPVSPRMLYEMARRYDEWPGEDYPGSSARGAMKGWHKHGVCADAEWPYVPNDTDLTLTHDRTSDAAARPLGAYFRVNHRDLVAMHAALAEVGVLYATAVVHDGWNQVGADGIIPSPEGRAILGGHAFAIVGFDETGFWIQNSWGDTWGRGGFALIRYSDWLTHATDVWVARLGAPVRAGEAGLVTHTAASLQAGAEYSFSDVRPHIVGIGNDGQLRPTGEIGTTPADLETIFTEDFPRLTKGWAKKRILLYAHGGLVGEKGAIQRVAGYRQNLLDAEVYPLAFIWKTDFWTTLANILKDAMNRRRPEGLLDATKDFMLDRLDDTLEILTRLPGRAVWDEMKENAVLATTSATGGAKLVLDHLVALLAADEDIELHIAAHSAGAIFMAPLVTALGEANIPVRTCTLWAPACTTKLFKKHYLPALEAEAIARFNLFTLKDGAERDDHCAHIYHKSLLYWVSNAFEDQSRIPLFRDGEPLVGMEKFILRDKAFGVDAAEVIAKNPPTVRLLKREGALWLRAPNGLPEGSPDATNSRRHGDFDDDVATVKATLARILSEDAPAPAGAPNFRFASSTSSLADRRRGLSQALA